MQLHATGIGLQRWFVMPLIVVLGMCATPTLASVTRGEPRNGIATDAFGAVGILSHFDTPGSTACSAVAILDGQYILTARHCVTTSGGILGSTREASGFRFQANGVTYQGIQLYTDFAGDLALIRLNGTVPDAFGLWDSQAQGSELGLAFRGVGFGATDANGDGRWGPSDEGIKRTFNNTIDQIITGTIPGQGPVLRYDFDLAALGMTAGSVGDSGIGELEGIHGPGDSGGAALIEDPLDSNTLLLAGLMSSAGDPVNGATGSLVQVSAYRNDIINIVPEPTSALLLATVLGLGTIKRRGR